MFKKLWANKLVRYCAVGAGSYSIELSALIGLHRGLGLSPAVATAIAFWIGLIVSFILLKLFAFRDYNSEVKAITRQGSSYVVLVAFNYAFTIFIVSLFPDKYVVYSRTLALVVTTAWNYLIYQRLIFRRQTTVTSGIRLREQRNRNETARPWFASRKRPIYIILLSAPIVLFFYQYLATGSRLAGGDFDYYSQLYEAFRISVLKFHQLPLWNAWMSGGIPLYANPQFGLISIQSLLVLPFGAIYGMKLAYVIYALAGFWGMYTLARKVLLSTKTRAAAIGYIWIFCGFFAGHGISHFTFALFFLLPWLIYLVLIRDRKWSWLWFGLLESLIILSSVHYAFLMTNFTVVVVFMFTLFRVVRTGKKIPLQLVVSRKDVLFTAKVAALVIVLAGYRFITTFYFTSSNPRIPALLIDKPTPPHVLGEAIFLPIATHLKVPANLQWGWAEYSMYVGIGAGVALFVCLVGLFWTVLIKRKPLAISGDRRFLLAILSVGLLGLGFALGDYSNSAPFHLLRLLPGFSDTRVSARWLIITTFAILMFLAAWNRQKRVVNGLLIASALELFLSFGPPTITGQDAISIPPATFSASFTEYDNGRKHSDGSTNKMHLYYYTTSRNIGQIYSDDSSVNSLDGVVNTSRCGINVNPRCTFVLTGNAEVVSWSPNSIVLARTRPGPIELNMNVDRGWQVNGEYPFAHIGALNPVNRFVLPENETYYHLTYAPKLSPSWLVWRAEKL